MVSIPGLSSFCLFDLDGGFEERVLALRFDSGAEGFNEGEAKWGFIIEKVSSSRGVRGVDGEGNTPNAE